MTTEELIKKMRECAKHSCCFDCEYISKYGVTVCTDNMLLSAAERLEQLESRLAAVTANRDKAVENLRENSILPYGGCHLCSHIHTDVCSACRRNDVRISKSNEKSTDLWQWRGVEQEDKANES
ncbi:MAG: hypothetical protein NC110_05765 [Ruminococcus sp.]|nr:hypothetical protein [Ruminococcus sp.]